MVVAVEPPHAPERGRSAKIFGRFHVTGVFWYKFWLFGARNLHRHASWPFILLFTTFFFICLIRIRRAVGANLQTAMGPVGWWRRQGRAYKTLFNFAWCITERYERLAGADDFEFEVEGVEHWQAAVGDNRGAILLTAHVGNWEVGAALPAERRRRVHLVREAEMDPEAQEFTEKLLRDSLGETYVTHFADLDVRLGMEMRDALDLGELVALQGDRPRRGGRSVEVPLFGKPFSLPAGPIVLGRTAGAPILPVFVLRTGRRRYRLIFRPPVRVSDTADRRTAIAEAAQEIVGSIEWAIHEAPNQWFCFRRLF